MCGKVAITATGIMKPNKESFVVEIHNRFMGIYCQEMPDNVNNKRNNLIAYTWAC